MLVNSIKHGDMDALNLRGECKVCYDLPVRTVFVNCGHIEPTLLERSLCWGCWTLGPKIEYECMNDCNQLVRVAGESAKRWWDIGLWRNACSVLLKGGVKLVCCTRCALELVQKQLPCPICREHVGEADVIRLHAV